MTTILEEGHSSSPIAIIFIIQEEYLSDRDNITRGFGLVLGLYYKGCDSNTSV